MAGFTQYLRGIVDGGTSTQVVEQRPEPTQDTPAQSGNTESQLLELLRELQSEVRDLRSRVNAPAVADAPQVNAPVVQPVSVPNGWVDVSNHTGTLTQFPDERVRRAAGYANSRLGGYTQYMSNGMFNLGEIERRRAENDAGNGGSTAQPRNVAVVTPSGKGQTPSPSAVVTPLDTLVKQKRFSKLSVFRSGNKEHRHWTGTIRLDDGTILTLTDFPYDPIASVAQNRGYIPATLQTAFTAYFGDAIRRMDGAGVPGGTRDQFSMAIARALGAKGNGQYVHALDGHRNVNDWLEIASKAIGRG